MMPSRTSLPPHDPHRNEPNAAYPARPVRDLTEAPDAELGYASAFSAMVRRSVGDSPRRFLTLG